MKFRFAEAARRELNEAAAWLEEQEAGLGMRFLAEISEARQRIIDFPAAWAPLGKGLRRCHLKRFRYGLIYRIKGDVIEIIAVAHDRRLPEYWRNRKADMQ
jgi:plasmid stabilization system protein ParE